MAKDKGKAPDAGEMPDTGKPAAPANDSAEIRFHNTKRANTQASLDGQKKVTLLLPSTQGQPPEYVVNINGCVYVIPVGKPCEVPEQVAEMMHERLRSEGVLKQKSDAMMDAMKKGGAD